MKTLEVVTIGALLVVVLFLATRKTAATKVGAGSSSGASNSLLGFGQAAFTFATTLVSSPSKTPGLSDSKRAADEAQAQGLPISQTQGNGLMDLGSLDGSGLVTS